MLKDLIKLLISVCITLVLVLLMNFIELYFKDMFVLTVVSEIIKIVSVLLLARTLLGIVVFGATNGLVFGIVESLLRNSDIELLPLTVLMHVLTTLISCIGVYALKKTKSILFLWVLAITLSVAVAISYYFQIYHSLIFNLLSSYFPW